MKDDLFKQLGAMSEQRRIITETRIEKTVLPLSSAEIPGRKTAWLRGSPSTAFRPMSLIIPEHIGRDVSVTDIMLITPKDYPKAGKKGILIGTGALDGLMFRETSPESLRLQMYFPTVVPGRFLAVQIRNNTRRTLLVHAHFEGAFQVQP